MELRGIEKTKKWGYIFRIYYNGEKFFSFDELKDKRTVKGEFKRVMNSLGFSWAKGIQQGGRTDAKVSAENNLLYLSSEYQGYIKEIIKRFNTLLNGDIFIKEVIKTIPNLSFPDWVERREYIYSYPKKKIKSEESEILKRCEELCGIKDVSRFTDKKGLELKQKIREVEVEYRKGRLYFSGDSFMPKQVRNMSGYILTGEIKTLEGKYLTLQNVVLKKELLDKTVLPCNDLKVELVERCERTKDEKLYIFYVKKENKGKVIGRNGGNIKNLKKVYGDIIIREI